MKRFPARQRAIIAAMRDAREKIGLSQRALTEKLGEPLTNFIHRVESLERDISVSEFVEIVETMGEDAPDLLRAALKRLR